MKTVRALLHRLLGPYMRSPRHAHRHTVAAWTETACEYRREDYLASIRNLHAEPQAGAEPDGEA